MITGGVAVDISVPNKMPNTHIHSMLITFRVFMFYNRYSEASNFHHDLVSSRE